jgi:hypothetical protein
LEPFDTVRLGETEAVYVGVEDGFVNKKDFLEWKTAFKLWLKETYDQKGPTFSKLDGSLIRWAIGMLWPDQSYVSLRTYRNKSTEGWSEFHLARFRMYTGKFLFCDQISNVKKFFGCKGVSYF